MSHNDCIFCKIIAGDISASIEQQTDNVFAFRSTDPVAEFHILVVPKKHIAHFGDISKEDGGVMIEMVEVAQRLVHDLGLESGYKLVFNAGKYQAIPHLHWHLLAGKLEESDPTNNT